ncbi:MAG: Lrp/AsnC ligand binding domain-containing protein [candidate division Zixibacteria bacterium]|nr:Lrp/AsnC ligand binding domain-containing protein [candidate division Zixibacteria bacterium]
MITAIILVNTEVERVRSVADALTEIPGVVETYSVAGDYDLVSIVRVKQHEDFAGMVTENIRNIPGIIRTNTLIAFQQFPGSLMDRVWNIGAENKTE